jgi:hypothetical protein
VERIVFFLANAGLFRHPVSNWLLTRLFCIPVERRQDTGGKPLDNRTTFAKAIEHLEKGGCLYIAPEGSSFVERRLRKMKTGTARIALASESENDWNLGLTILPVGLNYSDPVKFRSHLLTIFGEPVRAADFREDWEKDEVDAVRKLTAHLEERLSALIIDTESDFEDALLDRLEILWQNEQPLPSHAIFQRTKNLQHRLREWKKADPPAFTFFAKEVFTYFEKLGTLNISDAALKGPVRPVEILQLIVLLPFAFLGYLSHFLPCFSAKKINDWFNNDLAYVPTFKFVAGVVTFPLFYALQIWVVSKVASSLGGQGIVVWLYALTLVPTGLIAEWFLKKWKLLQEKRQLKILTKKDKRLVKDLLDNRHSFLK